MENPWIETQCCHTQTYMFTFWGLSWFLCKMGATTFTSLALGEEWLKQWCKNHLQGQLLLLLGTFLQDFEGWWGSVRGEFILSGGTWAPLQLEEHGDHYYPQLGYLEAQPQGLPGWSRVTILHWLPVWGLDFPHLKVIDIWIPLRSSSSDSGSWSC